MARITTGSDKILKIDKWLGVNENPDGDSGLKIGEFSTSTNVKITNDYHAQKRPGTQNIANLLSSYSIVTALSTTDVLEEALTTTASLVMYPNVGVDDGGLLSLTGTPVTVTYSNHESHVNKYYRDANSLVWKFSDCVYSDGIVDGVQQYRWTKWNTITEYQYVMTDPGAYEIEGGRVVWIRYPSYDWVPVLTKGTTNLGYVYGASGAYPTDGMQQASDGTYYYYDSKVQSKLYTWKFYSVSVSSSLGNAPVQGIWSGRVANNEVICACCDGFLWTLSESGGVWTKQRVGAIDTTNKVHMFGFNSKLYLMNGVKYLSYDGTTLSEVVGYLPLVATARSYDGATSTLLERANMLNPKRRVRFSPDGTNNVFTLPETGIASLDYAKITSTGVTYPFAALTVNTTAGTVTFKNNATETFTGNGSAYVFTLANSCITTIVDIKVNGVSQGYTYNSTNNTITLTQIVPSSGQPIVVTENFTPPYGVNTIEIGYTVSTAYRSQIEAMTLSETFNGANDNRVFIYGDGSNKAFYSGLDSNGQPTAEYFPDLNVAHIGESNTAITSMIRHYDRLLAFKEDSAYSIRYDILELVNGVTTAGFYITPLNKGIGCISKGQAQIVVNHPRTLDGRSIFEWVATTTSGNVTSDQRNAQDVSQKVYSTIRELDLSKAIAFYDKVNKEYYVVENGVAIVQNTENGAWYVYRDFPAICMIVYKDELYYGTSNGYIRHVSRDYKHDCGEVINVWAETGSMDMNAPYMRKFSDSIFVVTKPEDDSSVNVTVQTDIQDDYTDTSVLEDLSGTVDSGIFDFANLDFGHFTFNVSDKPQTQKKKLKVKDFAWYKLIFHSADINTTFTLLQTSIKFRTTSYVR